jgi:hypothetical protein
MPMHAARVLLFLAAGALLLLGGVWYGMFASRHGLLPVGLLDSGASDDSHAGRPANVPLYVAIPRAQPDALMEELEEIGYGGQVSSAPEPEAVGVTQHDPARSSPGLNLIVASHAPQATLADMDGRMLHVWSYPWSAVPGADNDSPGNWRHARVEDDGRLFAIFDQHGVIALDRSSRLLWSLVGGYHHDLDVLSDGSLWVLLNERRILPAYSETRPTVEDFLEHVGADGRILGRFSLLKAFEQSEYAPLLRKAAKGGDIFHTNSVDVFEGELAHLSPLFAAGNALISVWGLDVIAIVDLRAERVLWALSGKWHRQHQPVLLEDGHILLFDNLGSDPWARVLEIDPFEQRTVWAYRGDEENQLLSHVLGSCQRLPNGNTLITESMRATAFEVTPEGDTVWRYVSPFRFEHETEDRPVLMEVTRLGPGWHPSWLQDGEPAGTPGDAR